MCLFKLSNQNLTCFTNIKENNMKKIIASLLVSSALFTSAGVSADQGKGLNVMLTSADRQAQMMAMVLSIQTLQKHSKELNMVICGAAGDLVLKETQTETMKPMDKSPTMLLNAVIKSGGIVEVCPLYLPNAGKTEADLIEGITIAKPPVVAGRLLDTDYSNLTY